MFSSVLHKSFLCLSYMCWKCLGGFSKVPYRFTCSLTQISVMGCWNPCPHKLSYCWQQSCVSEALCWGKGLQDRASWAPWKRSFQNDLRSISQQAQGAQVVISSSHVVSAPLLSTSGGVLTLFPCSAWGPSHRRQSCTIHSNTFICPPKWAFFFPLSFFMIYPFLLAAKEMFPPALCVPEQKHI